MVSGQTTLSKKGPWAFALIPSPMDLLMWNLYPDPQRPSVLNVLWPFYYILGPSKSLLSTVVCHLLIKCPRSLPTVKGPAEVFGMLSDIFWTGYPEGDSGLWRHRQEIYWGASRWNWGKRGKGQRRSQEYNNSYFIGGFDVKNQCAIGEVAETL